jgi:DNA-binding transcriptional regulator YdaS (Cro superfamily)
MSIQALEKAVQIAGGQSALARRICAAGGYAKQCHIWAWLNRNKKVPASQVLKIEKAVGIPRHELRPDIYPRDA